jgi:hypothetical protein
MVKLKIDGPRIAVLATLGDERQSSQPAQSSSERLVVPIGREPPLHGQIMRNRLVGQPIGIRPILPKPGGAAIARQMHTIGRVAILTYWSISLKMG